MTRPLWPAGIALWPLVASIAAPILPPEPGPFSERPWIWAMVVGGCCAIPLWVYDFVRQRRVWLGALIAGGTLFCLSLADIALRSTDADMDQQVGWAIVLSALVPLPVLVISLLVKATSALSGAWSTRRRRWRVEVEDSKVALVRRKPR